MPKGALICRVFVAVVAGTAIQGAIAVSSGGASTEPGPALLTPSTSPGPAPGSGASVATWQAWAAAQSEAVESTPWAQELADQGRVLLSLNYVTVEGDPGADAPAGVTTTAVVITYDSASGGIATSASGSGAGSGASPLTSGGKCTAITDGTACIESVTETGGYVAEASYTYEAAGTIRGHVEMTRGGCPGSLIKNGTNQTFTDGDYQTVVYGPNSAAAKWASTFWLYSGGNYTNWGSACSTL